MRTWVVVAAGRTRRAAPVVLGALLLIAGVVLTRGGGGLEPPVAEPRVPPTIAPSPPAPVPDGPVVVRGTGVDGMRLGTSAGELVTAGFVVQPRAVAGCRAVTPGMDDTGPGQGVAGWLVGDVLASVTVDARVGDSSSLLGPGIGASLDDVVDAAGRARENDVTGPLRRREVLVVVPWQPEPRVVDVVTVGLATGVRVSFTDLDDDGDVDHVQVLDPTAARCAAAAAAERAQRTAALPPLDLGGRGDLRVGEALASAAQVVALRDVDVPARSASTCRLVLGDDEPGLVYLVVSQDPTGQEVVRAVTVDAGTTEAGLRVGATPEQVVAAYPGLTTAYLLARWGQGLSVDWQVDGGTLRLWPTVPEVAVPEVDATLQGPGDVVGLIQVGPGC